MVDRKRKKVRQTVVSYVDLDYTPCQDVLEMIQEVMKEHGDSTRFEIEDFGGDSKYIVITKEVDESDQQMKYRISQEEYWENQRKERDRKEFERLKKQFGE